MAAPPPLLSVSMGKSKGEGGEGGEASRRSEGDAPKRSRTRSRGE